MSGSGASEAPEAPANEPTGNATTTVVVAQSAPTETPDDTDEEIGIIAGRVDALETRITEAIEGERTWATETITSLQRELADLRATLQAVTQNQPSQIAELKAELTRLQQELSRLMATQEAPETVQEDPPTIPPDNQPTPPEGADGLPEARIPAQGKRKRVV